MPEHIGRLTAAGYTKGSGVAKLRLEGTEETIVVEIPDGDAATDLADVAIDIEDAQQDGGAGLGSLLPDGSGAEVDDAPHEGIDVRPRMPDTPEEWKQVAEDEDVVVMLEAEEQAVFVAHVETDEFDRGYKWIANSIDPESGRRSNSFATHENLIDRWFQEAVPNCRAWKMDPEETPLEVGEDV